MVATGNSSGMCPGIGAVDAGQLKNYMTKETAHKFVEDCVTPETVAIMVIGNYGNGYEFRHAMLDESGKYNIGVQCAVSSAREYLAKADWASEPAHMPEGLSFTDQMNCIFRYFNTGKHEQPT